MSAADIPIILVWCEVYGWKVVAMPDKVCSVSGIFFGVTAPYNKPWDCPNIHAENEPAKPPL